MMRALVALALLSLVASNARALTYSAPVKVAGASNLLLTGTGATTVLTYTPKTAGSYVVECLSFEVVTATTNVTLTVSWTDQQGNAQTQTIVSAAAMATGFYSVAPIPLNTQANSAITVSATAGTANQLYVSANLKFGGL